MILPHIEPPGEVAIHINQEIRLSDNDYVGAGGHGLIFTPTLDDGSQMVSLMNTAAELSPLDDLARPGSAEDIATTVITASERIAAYSDSYDGEASVFVMHPDAASGPIQGTYVNGQLVDEADAPKAEDHLNILKEQNDDSDGDRGRRRQRRLQHASGLLRLHVGLGQRLAEPWRRSWTPAATR